MLKDELLLLDFIWKVLVAYNPSTEANNYCISTTDETDLN